MKSPTSSSTTSITKENLLKKYAIERAKIGKFYQQSNTPHSPHNNNFHLNLQSMPDDQQKELQKMQSIFNQYIEEQNMKRLRERNKQVLTFETLAEKRKTQLASMDPTSVRILVDEKQDSHRQETQRLESQKVFEDIKKVQKVSEIVSKTKLRISNKQLNKEQRFLQKFELFKQMDSYLEVKDLLQRLNNLDGSSVDDSKTNSRLFESRQNKMASILEGVEKERHQDGNEQEDDEYQELLQKNTELMKKVDIVRKQQVNRKRTVNNDKQLNQELINLIAKELDDHIASARKVSVGDESYNPSDAFITDVLKRHQNQSPEVKKEKKKGQKKSKPVSAKGFLPQISPGDQPQSEEVYKQFKDKSQRIMNFLINQSKLIYKKKQAEPLPPPEKKRRVFLRTKINSVPEIKRHETQKKSAFSSMKSSPLRSPTPKPNTTILKYNQDVNLLQKEHNELALLQLPQHKFKELRVMSLKQDLYDESSRSPTLTPINKKSITDASKEDSVQSTFINTMQQAKIHMMPTYQVKHKLRTKKLDHVQPVQNYDDSPSLRIVSPIPSPEHSVDSDKSESQASLPSNVSEQRYRTNKAVKMQRKVIQILLEKIEKTKETMGKEKKHYNKRIAEIEENYEIDLQRFKPESVESLKYFEVNRNRKLDLRKHVFKRKK